MKNQVNIGFFKAAAFVLLFSTCSIYSAKSQNVGINTSGTAANASALLDLNTGNTFTAGNGMGLLVPNVALTVVNDAATILTPATSLLVYVPMGSGLSPAGYYYNSGTPGAPVWTLFATGAITNDWQILGNTGTRSVTNFIGTTDTAGLMIRTNNTKRAFFTGVSAGLTNFEIFAGSAQVNTTPLMQFKNSAGDLMDINSDDPSDVFIGYQAGMNNNVIGGANSNVFIGYQAGRANTTAYNNTGIGWGVLAATNTGFDNTALGNATLFANTTGNENTAIGNEVLLDNTTGVQNTGTGHEALLKNTTGSYNTADGVNALFFNTIGSYNNAEGYNSLVANGSGNYNNAMGGWALANNSTGSNNIAIGYGALRTQTTASNNIAIGDSALAVNTGTPNTAIGYKALKANTTGANNVALGDNALGTNTTGSQNTALGSGANVASAALSNCTAIGYNASVSTSNTMTMGNNSVTQFQFNGALMPYYGAAYNAGTANQILVSQGPGAAPQWTNPGTISSLTAWQITGNTGITASTSAIGVLANNNFIGTNNPADFIMAANGYERMRIANSTGNIGVSNINPTTLMQVGNGASTGKFSVFSADASWGEVQIGNPTVNAEASITFISGVTAFGTAPSSASGTSNIWNIGAGNAFIGGNKFGIGNDAYGGTMATWTSAGLMGILTTTPNRALEIGGLNNTLRIDGLITTGTFYSANTAPTAASSVMFASNTTGDVQALAPSATNGQVLTQSATGPAWSNPVTSNTLENYTAANATLTTIGTWQQTGSTISLSAGTWLVTSETTLFYSSAATGTYDFEAYLGIAGTAYTSGQSTLAIPNGQTGSVTISLSKIITVAVTTSIYTYFNSATEKPTCETSLISNSKTANTATGIHAVRLQ